ncbi:long-chain-fatty-acid--CoA ligase [Bradyrhizobium sp. NP1]|uniref:long-chain-fatty-acid--CoA ligase n=1 Tax=Bradyrhizobium sp. NP1 TaxID=3049772 RepID=UPI0025A5A49B|nr:long-chain-fatty-acid--CoA ligase [Bradyrhizobium sp. NP1]WJR76624.1 long-chain-fatty-acid--CoA ligase [Bradyrhizobium sp. NP1]
MRIDDIIWHNARARADKLAVACGAVRLSFAQLAERSRKVANALAGLGVQRGERVAVLATNTAEYVEVVFGIAAAGAVWVPLNFRLAAEELEFIIADSEAAAVVYTHDMVSAVDAIRDRLPAVRTWIRIGGGAAGGAAVAYDDMLSRAKASAPSTMASSADLFTIMYTSGTTGRPKGAMLSHEAFSLGTLLSSIALNARPEDVKLQVIPQFHAGGQIYQLCHLAMGSTIVVCPRFDPDLVLRLLTDEGATAVGLVPSMLVAMLEAPAIRKTDLSRLTRVMYGGSSIPEDRLAQALELTNAAFLQTYGQTEAGVLVSVLDAQDHRAGASGAPQLLRSCGRAMLGYDIRIVDDAGRAVPDGELGELCVRGPSLMQGYWKKEAATAATLVEGQLHTGDVARRDGEGRFYIVDRKKDMIISGGENIASAEVEGALSGHPSVLDVAVIGVPDERWGEAVKAIVVRRAGSNPSADELLEHCRNHLGGFKVPKSVDFVDNLPRNASGKVLKAQLRNPYWEGRARKV